ncbi:MAG: methenyltetrahydromethanopterin cyclohydrolase [Chloroflexi bacterium]|nr:methenyltetrahydromethanopterin cyclohydrolase [Chloroflexota bacterium]
MFSISQESVRIVREKILPYAEQLNCQVHQLKNGAIVIDMGIEAPGGWMAGKLFVEATIGGLGHVDFGRFQLGQIDLPSIDVYIDHPATACLSSQFSSWPLPQSEVPGAIRPLGSGPARAIARIDFFSKLWDYQDNHHETVFAIQADALPDESLAEEVARECHLSPKNLYILAVKTGSIAGSIQVCSRTIETSIWCLHYRGFDLHKVICGSGTCPVVPPVADEFKALVRVNAAVVYGGSVRYVVDATDEEVQAVIDRLPTSAAPRYGEPFVKFLEESGRDVFKTDVDINSVAHYEIMNYATGNVFSAGKIEEAYLNELFF